MLVIYHNWHYVLFCIFAKNLNSNMSNKSIDNNSVLYNLLFELLGEDIESIIFDVLPDYTIVIFNDVDTRKFDKCQSVIETLVFFNLINVIDYFSDNGLYTYYIVFK